jgi:hypothetical protein
LRVSAALTNNNVSGVVNWTAQSQATGNLSLNISGNGAVDSGAAFSQTQMVMGSVSSTVGSTGCTTTPQYTVYAKAWF